jgi:hypothetical protein
MPDWVSDATCWLSEFFGHDGTQIVFGAFIAGIVGYTANQIQRNQSLRESRQAWGSLLFDQLTSQPPQEYPIHDDPPTVTPLTYSAIPHLLHPGILRLPKERHLLVHLSFLESAVNNYNSAGQLYNSAWQGGSDRKTLQHCMNNIAIGNIDYKNAHLNVMNVIASLYEPQEGDHIPEPNWIDRPHI